MTTRIYLREKVRPLIDGKMGTLKLKLSGREYMVAENHGNLNISTSVEPFNPIQNYPRIPSHFIRRVAYVGYLRFRNSFRPEGVYNLEGAVSTIAYGRDGDRLWQTISISAPSFRKLKNIYTRVCGGLLSPEKNWSGVR